MVILVDQNDQPIGTMPKIDAHQQAALHRAFSILIFNSRGEMLIHQRALDKYHTPGLWTNACCSHPFPGEETSDAAVRRLGEEMGMGAEVEFVEKFTYRHEFDNGLTEHETDHVFVGHTDQIPIPAPEEVNAYKYVSLEELKSDMAARPEAYTPWFKIIMQRFGDRLSTIVEKKAAGID